MTLNSNPSKSAYKGVFSTVGGLVRINPVYPTLIREDIPENHGVQSLSVNKLTEELEVIENQSNRSYRLYRERRTGLLYARDLTEVEEP